MPVPIVNVLHASYVELRFQPRYLDSDVIFRGSAVRCDVDPLKQRRLLWMIERYKILASAVSTDESARMTIENREF